MAKNHILLTDADTEHAEILDLALRNSGYRVAVTGRASEALEILTQSEPCIGIFNFSMPVKEGRTLLSALQERDGPSPRTRWIFLASSQEIDQYPAVLRPQRAEYLNKPVYLRELIARVRLIIDQKRRERWNQIDAHETTFAGSLSDISVLDLVQQIDLGQKSGELLLEVEVGRGKLWFQDGQILDVSLGRLQAEAAFYRLLRCEGGKFSLTFKSLRRANVMKASTRRLILEGLRRRQEWERLCEQLPPLDQILKVSSGGERSSQSVLSADAAALVQRFCSGRSAQEILEETKRDELELLRLVSEAYFQGALKLSDEASQSGESFIKKPPEMPQAPLKLPTGSSRSRRRPSSFTEPIAEMDVEARFAKRGQVSSKEILDELSSKLGEFGLESNAGDESSRVEGRRGPRALTPDRPSEPRIPKIKNPPSQRPRSKTLTTPFSDLENTVEEISPVARPALREVARNAPKPQKAASAKLEGHSNDRADDRANDRMGDKPGDKLGDRLDELRLPASSRADLKKLDISYLSETKFAGDPGDDDDQNRDSLAVINIRAPSKLRPVSPTIRMPGKISPGKAPLAEEVPDDEPAPKSPPTLRGVSVQIGQAKGARKAPPSPPPHLQSTRQRSRTAAFLPDMSPGQAAVARLEEASGEPDFVMNALAANDPEQTLELQQTVPILEKRLSEKDQTSKIEEKDTKANPVADRDSSTSRHNRDRLTYVPRDYQKPWYASVGAWMACAVTVTLVWSQPWQWMNLPGLNKDQSVPRDFAGERETRRAGKAKRAAQAATGAQVAPEVAAGRDADGNRAGSEQSGDAEYKEPYESCDPTQESCDPAASMYTEPSDDPSNDPAESPAKALSSLVSEPVSPPELPRSDSSSKPGDGHAATGKGSAVDRRGASKGPEEVDAAEVDNEDYAEREAKEAPPSKSASPEPRSGPGDRP